MTLIFERLKLKTVVLHKLLKIRVRKLNKIALNRLASLVLLLAIFPTNIIGMNNYQVGKTNLKLALNTPLVFAQESKSPTIQVGESNVDREARLKAEEESKRQAEAKNAALAQAQAIAQAKAQAQRNTVSRESRNYSDPSNFDEIYARAGSAYGVDPRILKSIHTVETGASGSTARSSSAGAQGQMQFLPSTWKRHGVDGNGDGVADITNVVDAIYTAAEYLKACGYPDMKKALWGYNPSTSYYNKVIGIAHSLGF